MMTLGLVVHIIVVAIYRKLSQRLWLNVSLTQNASIERISNKRSKYHYVPIVVPLDNLRYMQISNSKKRRESLFKRMSAIVHQCFSNTHNQLIMCFVPIYKVTLHRLFSIVDIDIGVQNIFDIFVWKIISVDFPLFC